MKDQTVQRNGNKLTIRRQVVEEVDIGELEQTLRNIESQKQAYQEQIDKLDEEAKRIRAILKEVY